VRFADGCVLAVYAALVLGIGQACSRQNQSADDFLLARRQLSPWALGLSLFATLVSTLSYLGSPGEMIAHGPMLFTQFAAQPLIFLILGYGLIPRLMQQPVTSAYELLESRLGTRVRQTGAALFLLLRVGWMATILYATSSAVLVPLLKLDPYLVPVLCCVLGAITAAYSAQGGLRAVVITDAVQAITMLFGAVATIVVISWQLGGVSGWWPQSWPAHWQAPSWGFDPSARVSFGVLFLSSTSWYVCTHGSDQMSIQRFLSSRDAAAARRTLLVAQISDITVATLMGLTGLAVLGYCMHQSGGALSSDTLATQGDQLFPRFILEEMPAGLTGLVLAAILSAALSSLSSGVNSTCAVLERDFLAPSGWFSLSDAASLARLRWLTWCVMSLSVAISMLNLLLQGNLIERCFKLINLLTAPLFVLFFLALFVPWANASGAMIGLGLSVMTAVTIAYAEDLGIPSAPSFIWIIPSALTVGITVGTIVSAITSRRQRVS
jgi:solute:Na+ symporter, SSS family